MKVYVFGNEDVKYDRRAFEVVEQLKAAWSTINFIRVKPNEDLPFTDLEDVVIMDVILGLAQTNIIQDAQLSDMMLGHRSSVHDFDVGFQLKYLKKLGKLGRVTIIGLPTTGKINYNLIHSTLRKLVAQDMQGS
ncbi:hypothetical protein KJ605_02100 [Patescibacteria group bacterium]|nr:hypothetical protein [Patescibacteria group bacterium]MBU1970544.1 hypothetical protein [Patescibacteria group bacterium]